jgi:hypothetical protein
MGSLPISSYTDWADTFVAEKAKNKSIRKKRPKWVIDKLKAI